MNKELAYLLKGKTDPMEIAKTVSAYTKRSAKKRTIAEERREWFHNIIGNVRKVAPGQIDALVYEYCMDNDGQWTFSAWLHNRYPVLFAKQKANAISTDIESQGL